MSIILKRNKDLSLGEILTWERDMLYGKEHKCCMCGKPTEYMQMSMSACDIMGCNAYICEKCSKTY